MCLEIYPKLLLVSKSLHSTDINTRNTYNLQKQTIYTLCIRENYEEIFNRAKRTYAQKMGYDNTLQPICKRQCFTFFLTLFIHYDEIKSDFTVSKIITH